MNTGSGTETFEFDADFLEKYTFLLNKYTPDHATCSASELLEDIQVNFSCHAAALICYKPGVEPLATLCHPSNEHKLIRAVLEQADTDAHANIYFLLLKKQIKRFA